MTSPRSNILNCQQLKVHLPPLRDCRDLSTKSKYSSPPVSTSPVRTKIVNNVQNSYDYRRHHPTSPTSTRSGSGKQSPTDPPSISSAKSLRYDDVRSTATSTPALLCNPVIAFLHHERIRMMSVLRIITTLRRHSISQLEHRVSQEGRKLTCHLLV